MSPSTNLRPFVHLRTHSTYSLGVGYSSPAELCAHAARMGYAAMALTDVNGTYGYVELHHAARVAGLKPIYGGMVFVDLHGDFAGPPPQRASVALIALDRTGLRNVCATLGLGAERRERGERLAPEDVAARAAGAVAVFGLPGRVQGEVPDAVLRALEVLRAAFGDRLFVEVRTEIEDAGEGASTSLEAAARTLGIAPVLCQDVRFAGPQRREAGGLVLPDEESPEQRVHGDRELADAVVDQALMTPAEISAWHEWRPEAYQNASMIASLVQPDLLASLRPEEGTGTSASATNQAFGAGAGPVLRELVLAALEQRFAAAPREERERGRERVERELELIERAGLETTFLRFHEITDRLERMGVLLGPATGLRLQSTCAWLLGITRFDPYAIDDRFVPFFDERDRENHVLELQISTDDRPAAVAALGHMFESCSIGYVPSVERVTAARALRIAARRLQAGGTEVDDVLRVAARHSGASLQELCTQNGRIGSLYRRSATVRDLIGHAAAIEGLTFGFVRSKRTLIVSPTPLGDFLGRTVNPETGEVFVQSTRDAFPMGAILRVDVATLNAVGACARLGAPFDDSDRRAWLAGADDAGVFEAIARGDVEGIHLLETPLVQRLVREVSMRTFRDLVVFVALMRYRRRGLTLAERIGAFAETAGAALDGPDEVAQALLHTHGWILFDDQLRDLIATLTGLDPREAAVLGRRFAREEPGQRASLRRSFMRLAAERGTELEHATAWFARILHAAGSTVARQGAIADALVAVTMAHLRSGDEIAFFTELANVYRDNPVKQKGYLDRLRAAGVLGAPDINESDRDAFRRVGETVRPPLSKVDGVDPGAAARIAAVRGEGKIGSFEEFALLIDDMGITYKEVEALVRAGAFESVGTPAGARIGGVGDHPKRVDARRQPVRRARAPRGGQLAFDFEPTRRRPRRDPPQRTLRKHKAGNKRGGYHVIPAIAEFYPHPSASPVELAGRIRDLRFEKTSSGETVGFFELYDSSGCISCFVPWERVDRHSEPPADGDSVSVRGTVRIRDGKKICEVLEVEAAEGGISHGETTPDLSAEGDT